MIEDGIWGTNDFYSVFLLVLDLVVVRLISFSLKNRIFFLSRDYYAKLHKVFCTSDLIYYITILFYYFLSLYLFPYVTFCGVVEIFARLNFFKPYKSFGIA